GRRGELPDAAAPADLRPARRRRHQEGQGQPAQLGRQGHAGGPLSAAGGGPRGRDHRGRRALMGPWRRHRRATPRLRPRQQADAWQVVSLLLEYPEPLLLERVPLLREVTATLPDPVAAPPRRFLDHVGATPLAALQRDYVDTFDVTRRCCLHLTYFTHGDTRRRGVALVQFKQAYRRAGVVLADEQAELPDHLAVVLEFGAAHDPDA